MGLSSCSDALAILGFTPRTMCRQIRRSTIQDRSSTSKDLRPVLLV